MNENVDILSTSSIYFDEKRDATLRGPYLPKKKIKKKNLFIMKYEHVVVFHSCAICVKTVGVG